MLPSLSVRTRLAAALLVAGLATTLSAAPATTVVLVRHAEKEAGSDPGLTEAGRGRASALARALADAPVAALYSSQFRRTRETLEPLAGALDREVKVAALDTSDVAGSLRDMAKTILADHAGETVVVAGHSNTVPMLIEALGVQGAPELGEKDYDDLFVVVVGNDGATLLRLHYGEPSP